MTGGRPLISVVIPAHNVSTFILGAVESVLEQSFSDLELIVVDDGSTDGTADRLAGVPDARFRLISQQNAGSSAARNSGIRLASGRYIAFLDGDDLWMAGKLEAHIRFLERHPETDLTFSRSEVIDETGAVTGRTSQPASGVVSFQELLIENVINNGSAVVMRRSALDLAGHFDSHLRSCVDLDLWLRVALLRSGNIFCINDFLTKYRMRSGQITKDWRRMETGWLKVFEKAHNLAAEQTDTVAASAHAKLYRYLAYIAYENKEYLNSSRCLLTAFRFSATTCVVDRRTWVLVGALFANLVLPGRIHRACEAWIRRRRSCRPSVPCLWRKRE